VSGHCFISKNGVVDMLGGVCNRWPNSKYANHVCLIVGVAWVRYLKKLSLGDGEFLWAQE
jgi:hypothetical protein